MAQRAGIAFETVFSADDKLDFLTRAWEAHYFIRVFFVGTSDPRINAARVADRNPLPRHADFVDLRVG